MSGRTTEEILSGKRVVITGFTGFLAKVFAAMLLEHVPDIGRLTVLARPKGRLQSARYRTERIVDRSPVFRSLRARYGAGLGAHLAPRLEALSADIERPGCAMSQADLESLEHADVIVHCAGLTDFEPDPMLALASNVAGALSIADLAERYSIPMVHISTCYVAGSLGSAVVEESLAQGVSPSGARLDPGAEIRARQLACRGQPSASERIKVGLERARALGWPNIYTYTKALAEHSLARRPGLDLTIVRPSIVECARSYPLQGWNEGLNTAGPLAWLISTAFRRLPAAPSHTFDVVPVDDVAKGLAAITAAAIERRAGGVFQLASGDHSPLTFDRAVELTGLGMRRWTRRGAGSTADRLLFRLLDPVPVSPDAPGPFDFQRMRSLTSAIRSLLPESEPKADNGAASLADQVRNKLLRADDSMDRIDKMLALYKPFLWDNDWTFRTDRARALTQHEPFFRFDLSDIDWCSYWVDTEYPGLRRWCIPLIDGETIELDPPGDPPFRLPDLSPAALSSSATPLGASVASK